MAISECSIEATIPKHPEQHSVVFYKPNPPAEKLELGYQYDTVVGTLYIPPPPEPGDLRAGVNSGDTLGTLIVPPPAAVLAGVPTDDTIGTLEVLSEARPVPSPTNVSISLPPPTPRGLRYA